MNNKKMGTLVSTRTKMTQEMREALTHFEFMCIYPKRRECTSDEVVIFLEGIDESGELAKTFKPAMMSKPPI